MNKLRIISAFVILAFASPTICAETRTRYSHGDPTPDEQHMLELINRARANPAAEGRFLCNAENAGVMAAIRYFKVDTDGILKDFTSYPARPPLAFNPLLMGSARAHSSDMGSRNFQSHDSSDGTPFVNRVAATGYPYSFIGENVYSLQVPDTLFAHAGLNIDWGLGTGGVQPGVGHRLNIMNFDSYVFKEVGIGVIARSGGGLQTHGKLAITQDFGVTRESTAFLLGVVFTDKNTNGICDPGEGLSGVTVLPSVGTNYAVTSMSGGYAIPFESAARGVLSFSGGAIDAKETRDFAIGEDNVKIDLIPAPPGKVLSPVSLEMVRGIARETRGQAKFRIVRSGPNEKPLTVVIHRSKGGSRGKARFSDYSLKAPGIQGADGSSRDFRVTIPGGKSSVVVSLKATNDRKDEADERVTFTIIPTASYLVAKSPPMTIVIKR